jgi:hypothetical protein
MADDPGKSLFTLELLKLLGMRTVGSDGNSYAELE